MCGFEGNNIADLRADFGIFADTKHQGPQAFLGAPWCMSAGLHSQHPIGILQRFKDGISKTPCEEERT